MAPPPLALTLPLTRWHFSSQYTSVPHCEHFILAPSASQLPQRPTALLLPSLLLPCALSLLFALPSPFLRGVPSAPPRSSGWGRWKTVGSYEAVEEEGREPLGSGSGSSAAPPFSESIARVQGLVASVGSTRPKSAKSALYSTLRRSEAPPQARVTRKRTPGPGR